MIAFLLALQLSCGLDQLAGGEVIDWQANTRQTLSPLDLASIQTWSGEDIAWDDETGFDMPVPRGYPIEYDLLLYDGSTRYLFVWTLEGVRFVFGFYDLELGNDGGAHHLCAAFRME